jgi:hypothetical protein
MAKNLRKWPTQKSVFSSSLMFNNLWKMVDFELAIFEDFWPYKKNLKKFWGMAGWMSRGEEDSRH